MQTEKDAVLWGIHCGHKGDDLFLRKNLLGIGWPDLGNLREIPSNRDGFKKAVAKQYPHYPPGKVINSASQLFRFVHEMKSGELAVYRSKIDRQIHIGEISGDYEYRPDVDEEYVNVRPVKWIGTFPLTLFSQGALYELGSALTLFQVRNFAEEYLSALGTPRAQSSDPESTDEDETVIGVAEKIIQNTEDFIYKQLAQHLKGYEFQTFVAQLLSTMGYRTVVSPEGTDGGIDIVAHKDELKLEPPIIKVQVKSTEGSVGAPDVRQLSGNLSQGEVGLLVTLGSYSRQASEFAKSRANIRLIDGDDLIELILKHYEQLDARYKQLLPLKRVYVPEPLREDEA